MAKSASRSGSSLCTALDPRGQPTAKVQPHPLARRLDTIEGKTVYIIDVGFGGGWEFLEETRDWFARKYPNVKTILQHKKGIMFADEPEMWKEIKENGGDAVIFGVGG
jgi:predicted TIM-barrel fold metal-dependent hydrolase